jgi:hypothetical protein
MSPSPHEQPTEGSDMTDTDDRPSIAALQRVVGTNPYYPHRIDELQTIRKAAQVLLEIVAAALAWQAVTQGNPQPFEVTEQAKQEFIAALSKVRQ